MNFSVDITKNNGIVPDGHGSNTVFKSGLVAFSDFFRVNYFNVLITRFAFFLQTLFKMVMWVATFLSEGYKIRSIFCQKSTTQRKLLYFGHHFFLSENKVFKNPHSYGIFLSKIFLLLYPPVGNLITHITCLKW